MGQRISIKLYRIEDTSIRYCDKNFETNWSDSFYTKFKENEAAAELKDCSKHNKKLD